MTDVQPADQIVAALRKAEGDAQKVAEAIEGVRTRDNCWCGWMLSRHSDECLAMQRALPVARAMAERERELERELAALTAQGEVWQAGFTAGWDSAIARDEPGKTFAEIDLAPSAPPAECPNCGEPGDERYWAGHFHEGEWLCHD